MHQHVKIVKINACTHTHQQRLHAPAYVRTCTSNDCMYQHIKILLYFKPSRTSTEILEYEYEYSKIGSRVILEYEYWTRVLHHCQWRRSRGCG